LLTPAAAIYAAIADARMRQPGARVSVPVLCIGNFTAGGAGKTPTALALAKMLMARGGKPHFLTRGYGGSARGPLAVAPNHTAREVGDEALLLARLAPTVVARDRMAGAKLAVRNGADVIVMDDGFQNPSLHKDFSLIVIDGTRGFGNGRPIPAGPLRASLDAQLPRASAVLIVGAIVPAMRSTMAQLKARGIPVLTGNLQPDAPAINDLRGRKLMAFAGIGQPDKFFTTLKAAGLTVRATRVFADHHPFTKAQADALLDTAAREHLTLVTTEKDVARMRGDPALAQLADETAVVPVTMTFDDEAALRRKVIDRLLSGKSAVTSPAPGGGA
jgi:tetraacyldisaccharide 4'-kinase